MTTEEAKKFSEEIPKVGAFGFSRRFTNFKPKYSAKNRGNEKKFYENAKRLETDQGYRRKIFCISIGYFLEILVLLLSLIYIFRYENLHDNPKFGNVIIKKTAYHYQGFSIAFLYISSVFILLFQVIVKALIYLKVFRKKRKQMDSKKVLNQDTRSINTKGKSSKGLSKKGKEIEQK